MDFNAPARRVSYEQMKVMIDFMGQHTDFAMGALRTMEARHKSKKLWNELTKELNGIKGVKKSPDMWSRYWSDFKNKLKKKLKILNRKKRVGSQSDKEIKPLCNLEKRTLVILGPTFAKIRNKDEKLLPLEVKIEEHQNNGDFSEERSESSDRLSLDDDKEDDSEASSDEENGDEAEITLDESALSNIYPKWLIDMEKKRALAELIRAKTDEQRVAVAAKNAEAAIIQAEALKKLSEAATVQADALTRIASFLESRGHNNHHLLPM